MMRPGSSGSHFVQRIVQLQLHIEHFQQLLAKESDPTKRETLRRLLAEEEVKLAELEKVKERPPKR
jgi:hypothetical protein